MPIRRFFLCLFIPIVTGIFIILGIIINYTSSTILYNNIRKSFVLTENNLRYSLDNLFRSLNELYFQLAYYPDFEYLFESPDMQSEDFYNIIEKKQKLEAILLNSTASKPYILGSAIVDKSGTPLIYRNLLPPFTEIFSVDSEYYKSISSRKTLLDLSIMPNYKRILSNKSLPLVLLTRKISKFGYNNVSGYLTIFMDFQEVDQIFRNNMLDDNQIYCIFDKEGQLIYPEKIDPTVQASILNPENKQNVFRYNISNSDMVFVSYVPDSYINNTLTKLKIYFGTIYFVCLLLTIAIVYILMSRVTRPLNKLSHKIDHFHAGENNDLFALPPTKIHEIDTIIINFHAMTHRINALIDDIGMKKQKLLQSELTALQAQINPHFMLHALNSISIIARMNRVENICNLVNALSRLLKLSIYNTNTYIPLEDELQYLKDYVSIENYRSNVPIRLEVNMPEEIKDIKILKLLLQPIVENSITHGFLSDQLDCCIRIDLRLHENEMHIRISDNGVGIDETKIASVLAGELKTNRFSGIGIKNVNDRLALHFGEEYKIAIQSEKGKGTTVFIHYPVLREDKTSGVIL